MQKSNAVESGKSSGKSSGSVVSGWGSRLAALVAIASVGAIAAAFLLSPDSDRPGSPPSGADAVDVAKLVASTTKTRLPRAPLDTEPRATTEGDVVHPKRMLPVYADPDGRPFAKVTPNQMGETWLPVIDRRAGWVQVLLPSRPNGSTGWLKTSALQQARTPYLIRVHVGSRELELFRDGELLGRWQVAVGTAETPTPTGRTFLLGSIVDPEQSYSPVILPLGSHSDTLDSYGGGPGTVALHGWPDESVFGTAVSHGCIRVPADALEQLTQAPLGTLVLIDDN